MGGRKVSEEREVGYTAKYIYSMSVNAHVVLTQDPSDVTETLTSGQIRPAVSRKLYY